MNARRILVSVTVVNVPTHLAATSAPVREDLPLQVTESLAKVNTKTQFNTVRRQVNL